MWAGGGGELVSLQHGLFLRILPTRIPIAGNFGPTSDGDSVALRLTQDAW
jgi:hypothetical protein